MAKTLTIKQATFAKEYLSTGNATEAANRAYKPKNRNTAHAIGAENLRKPTIKRAVEKVLEESGLNTQLIAQSLVEDIKNKPMDRVSELLLASKLLGLLDLAKQRREDGTLPIPILGWESANVREQKPLDEV